MKRKEEELKSYSIPEVEEILKTTRQTIYRRIKNGSLKAFRIGNRWRITEQALKEFMKPDNKGPM